MNYLIVNYDIAYRLLQFTSFKTTLSFLRLNSYYYQMIVNTLFYKQLMLLKNCLRNKMIMCYIKGYVLVLHKLYMDNPYIHPYASHYAIENNQVGVLNWLLATSTTAIGLSNRFSINRAAAKGYLAVIQWIDAYFSNNKQAQTMFNDIVYCASEGGHVCVIDWAFRRFSSFKYPSNTIDVAAKNGHLAVLDWFIYHQPTFEYTEYAIDHAILNNHLIVLQWFVDHQLPLKYTATAIDGAMNNNQISILDWFKNNQLPLVYSENALLCLVKNERIQMLDWFLKNEFNGHFSRLIANEAIANGQIIILDWFVKNNLTIHYDNIAVYQAFENGHSFVLDWLQMYIDWVVV